MTIRDLIPWNRSRDVAVHRGENANPLLTLHREMNRVFDDVFRGFDVAPFGSDRLFDRTFGWPDIEVSETDKEVKVTAELPGLRRKMSASNSRTAFSSSKARKGPRLRTRIGSSASATMAGSSGASRSTISRRTMSMPRSRAAC